MKSFLALLLTAGSLAAPGVFQSTGPEAWEQGYYYRFQRSESAAAGTVDARVEYFSGQELLYRKRVTFQASGRSSVVVVLADPLAVSVGRGDDLRIQVLAGNALIESFDAAGFRAYNERLRAEAPAALAEAYAAHARDEDDAAARPLAGTARTAAPD